MAAPRPSTRASRDRRYRLAAAAIQLFTERGLEATTVEDIASLAGVSPRTFFRHFPTKEAAAFPDHDERVAELRDMLAARRAVPSPVEAVLEVAAVTAREYFEDPDLYLPRLRLLRRSAALSDYERVTDRKYEDAMADYLLEAFAGDTDARLRSRIIAGAVVAAVNTAFDLWAEDPSRDPETLLGAAMRLTREAFGAHGATRLAAADDADYALVVPLTPELRSGLAGALESLAGAPGAKTGRKRG